MPERNFSSPAYRYGFQGQEKDDEIKGEGNSINYTFRMHDPRVGRFFATDPLESNYPWQSTYVFAANNPIRLTDILGLGPGDPPTTAYHNTSAEAGEKILREGFKAGESGWNYFMTNPSGSKAGADVAKAPVQFETTINTTGAKNIGYKQWRQWYSEAKIELGIENIENGNMTKDQIKAANSIRNQKAVQFMNKTGGDAFIIEAEAGKSGQKFIVLSDKSVQANVEIKSVPRGQNALVSQMESISAHSTSKGSFISRATSQGRLFRYGRLALRFAGETLLIEGYIYSMKKKEEANKHYIERRSLNGHSPFYNWMMDTYTDIGLLDWYRYSIDLDK